MIGNDVVITLTDDTVAVGGLLTLGDDYTLVGDVPNGLMFALTNNGDGTLSAQLWRAIRLVVDTGIHHKSWTRQQVLDYMYVNAPVKPARAISEAERYMANPGQALGYKIGQLKIMELRSEAERALGEDFDIRDFHAVMLDAGPLPLAVLKQRTDRWIARSRLAITQQGQE